MKFKRIFLMVLDSLGVGETSDAADFLDKGANTLGHIVENCDLFIPNLKKIGFLDTINMNENNDVEAYYTIAKPINAGKDTLNGHYEMVGIKNDIPFRTFNQGFTYDVLAGHWPQKYDEMVRKILIIVLNETKIKLNNIVKITNT